MDEVLQYWLGQLGVSFDRITVALGELVRPFNLVKPSVYMDGDRWCALLGKDMMEGVVAFGRTPDEVGRLFDIAWRGGGTPTALDTGAEEGK